MTNVSCGLTAKKPGSAPSPVLIIEYGTTFLLYMVKNNSNYIPVSRRSPKMSKHVGLSVCADVLSQIMSIAFCMNKNF